MAPEHVATFAYQQEGGGQIKELSLSGRSSTIGHCFGGYTVVGIRPCLLPKKFYKIFQIPRHIESLEACMEY
jgi:hypothetical protein